MNLFEQLTFWILLVNEEWGGLFLPAVATVLIVLMVCALLAVRDRLGRRPSLEEIADPAHNPALDRTEALLRGWDDGEGR